MLVDYLTAKEAAVILELHPNYVRHLARSGKLPAVKRGVWLFPRGAVEAYARAIEGKDKHDPTRGR